MSEALNLLITFRDQINAAIERGGTALGDKRPWIKVGVLVIDTTSEVGTKLADQLERVIERSDDGGIAMVVCERKRLESVLDKIAERIDPAEPATRERLGAFIAIVDSKGIVTTGHIPGPKAVALFVLDAMREQLDTAVQQGIEKGVGSTWNDIGLVVANIATEYGRKAAEIWARQKLERSESHEQTDLRIVAVPKLVQHFGGSSPAWTKERWCSASSIATTPHSSSTRRRRGRRRPSSSR